MISTDTSRAIMTYSGRWIEPLNPDPDDICIDDIAHSLSNQCRFTGHTRFFYSVAQHSCLVSDICPPEHKLGGLLHDGTEAYLSDLARPIKIQPGFGEAYRDVEDILMAAVVMHFNLPWSVEDAIRVDGVRLFTKIVGIPLEIKKADNILLKTEIRDLMPPDTFPIDGGDVIALPNKLKTWSPSRSKQEFLDRFYYLQDGRRKDR